MFVLVRMQVRNHLHLP